jgi:hypothetical protein
VDNQIYYNKFQAFYDSILKNKKIDFVLYDDTFDKLSWSEPVESWDFLLDIRAQKIAAKNKPIILNFSGGTDSLTVYEVFKRNNIPLEAIHIKIKKDKMYEPDLSRLMAFLKSNTPSCKVFVSEDDVKTLEKFYNSSDWIWKKSARINFSVALSESVPIEENSSIDNSITDDYIWVTGIEKPRIKFINNIPYSYQEDTPFMSIMGNTRFENFFISDDLPELHVKQSYMLARFILSLSKKYDLNVNRLDNIETLQNLNYLEYAVVGCGRFAGDLANSHVQKKLNRSSKLHISQFNKDDINYQGRSKYIFEEGLKSKELYFENYINGLVSLRTDPIMSKIFTDTDNYYSIKNLQSKHYQLKLSTNAG